MFVCVCGGVIDRAREATRDRATHVIVCALTAAGLMAAVVAAAVACVVAACVCVGVCASRDA